MTNETGKDPLELARRLYPDHDFWTIHVELAVPTGKMTAELQRQTLEAMNKAGVIVINANGHLRGDHDADSS